MTQYASREALLNGLHHDSGIAPLWFAEKQMDMLGHRYIAQDDEVITAANLLQYFEKEITIPVLTEQGAALVTTCGDEVKVIGAVVAMELSEHASS